MHVEIRAFAPDDLGALYDISLATGQAGRDASALYADPRMIGHIYAAPYGVLLPEWCLMLEDDDGIAGYAVGAPDSDAFFAACEQSWWPELRAFYADPGPVPHRSADALRAWQIHHPEPAPEAVRSRFPGHMHMNLLKRARGKGLGRRLFETWRDKAQAEGVRGLHVGVSPSNAGGVAFWQACGFQQMRLERDSKHPALWFGLRL